ncbi:DUF4179 domain-containing protein [Jeotgalibacillus haloalkalitolerans]|uniref:DUF4179 domain-containing protein n=1 Tax=Jeotgalibacillus haloalkalitolerans TaxID=3104292 RepID=A0ABU5KQJ9_9BACL|nr:DUF4179 domain-containing protein [Jeotgalibacillus sp. HH7-29]MDZ5713444.1 DUF4179 domain-containing protein [Jeotgalibacillus sp. HH7-29]
MYQNEENNLKDYQKKIEQQTVPDERLDDAILKGVNRARQKNKRAYKKWFIPLTAAAILILSFVMTVRVSSVMAGHIASIPGMDRIVELIRDDRGLQSAVENDYIEAIGVSRSRDGVIITIDSVIQDEQGLVIFYTVEIPEPVRDPFFAVSDLLDKNDESVDASYSTGTDLDADPESTVLTGSANFFFEDGYSPGRELTVVFGDRQNQHVFEGEIKIPITLSAEKAETETYQLNKTISIEGQKLMIKEVNISPIRASVELIPDPSNEKKILAFEAMKMTDENGEEWKQSANGLTSTGDAEARTVYFESSYFDMPEELSMMIGRVQAVEREHEAVTIDTDTGKVISAPDDSGITFTSIDRLGIELEINRADFGYSLFSQATDAEGKTVDIPSAGYRSYDGKSMMDFRFEHSRYQNPLTLEFAFYPGWIESDEVIRIYE